METSQVKLFKNLCDDVIEFETVEDFDNYYRKNKEMIDKISTRGLNQKFKIKNHHIGRLKNEITLYPLKQSKVKDNNIQSSLDIADESGLTLHQKLNQLQNRIKNLDENFAEFLDTFYDFINEQHQQKQQPKPMQQTFNQQLSKSINPQRFNTFGI